METFPAAPSADVKGWNSLTRFFLCTEKSTLDRASNFPYARITVCLRSFRLTQNFLRYVLQLHLRGGAYLPTYRMIVVCRLDQVQHWFSWINPFSGPFPQLHSADKFGQVLGRSISWWFLGFYFVTLNWCNEPSPAQCLLILELRASTGRPTINNKYIIHKKNSWHLHCN